MVLPTVAQGPRNASTASPPLNAHSPPVWAVAPWRGSSKGVPGAFAIRSSTAPC